MIWLKNLILIQNLYKMYQLKLHPKIEDDLKELDSSLQIKVFKKLNGNLSLFA